MSFPVAPQQFPTGQPMPAERPAKVGPLTVLVLTLWRLLIATFGLIGFGTAVQKSGFSKAIQALSQQASLLTGIVYIGLALYPFLCVLRRHEPRSPWWRGTMTILLLLVAITFATMLEGDYSKVYSLFEHLLTPIVVGLDWLFVGRNQAAVKWWYPFTWLCLPLAYLVYYVIDDLKLYGKFLNPGTSSFPGTVATFLAAVLAAGYVLYGIGKLRQQLQRRTASSSTPAPQGS